MVQSSLEKIWSLKKKWVQWLASHGAALFLKVTSGRDWECVRTQMWIHALLQADLATLWAVTGSCDHAVNAVNYWPKWVSPILPAWLDRLWSRQACICLQKTMGTTCGEEQTSLLLLHLPFWELLPVLSVAWQNPATAQQVFPGLRTCLHKEKKSLEGCILVPLKIQRQSALGTGRFWDLDSPRSIWYSRNLAVFSGIICDAR